MRINELRLKGGEVSFDDFATTPDGGLDFHPHLTTHLAGTDWEKLYDGVAFSNRLGVVLNVHVTIAWEHAGIYGDDRVSAALIKWAGSLRKWCSARGYPCHYVYVHERGRQQGLHTHLLTSIPHIDRNSFQGWSRKYLQSMARVRPMPMEAMCVRHRGDGDINRQWLWFGYLTKGLAPWLEVRFRSDPPVRHRMADLATFRLRSTGIVRCRWRAGVSRNLDREARLQFGGSGFVSRFDEGVVARAQLFTDAYLREYDNEQELKRREERGDALRSLVF